jgi:ComF family protein
MVSDPKKLAKLIGRRRFSRPLRSSKFNFPSALKWFSGGACASISWLAQAALDFLIEDRCMICGNLSYQIRNPVDSSSLFSKFIAAAVRQPLCRFMQIENHPLCRECLSEIDETNRPGVIRITDSPEESLDACRSIPVISPFMTNDPVLKLVHLIKFSAYTALVPPVARSIQAAFNHYRTEELDSCILVPVPMHILQRKLRGFNQAELIARELSRDLDIPLQPEILFRHRPGVRQSMTPHENRLANVQGAFSSKKGSVMGKHVLLVDDLVTSGATASTCSSALLTAGADAVTILCLGRSL